jgi:small subunit ribosomal protein S8
VLEREGYIRGFERYSVRDGVEELKVELKYNEGEPVINKIERISKPGRRVYAKIKDLEKVYNGLGISIISTPRGVMSDQEARQANVGGEILCQVF